MAPAPTRGRASADADGPTRGRRSYLLGLPPSISGIALGCVGLAGTLSNVDDLAFVPGISAWLSPPLYVLSSLYLCAHAVRICASPSQTAQELRQPMTASPYGAFAMALALLSRALADTFADDPGLRAAGTAGVWVAAVLQFAVMARFLYACWSCEPKCPPEPFWFPPTVSLAMTGWTGASVGMPRWLIEVSFWGGVAICAAALPVAAFRTLRYPSAVAPNPTVAILQAPASFVTCAWFAIGGSHWLGVQANAATITVLFACSTLAFLVTVWSVVKRRRFICNRFTGMWASFTFPTISTTNGAMFYYSWTLDPSNHAAGAWLASALRVWAAVLVYALLPCVLCVILAYTAVAVCRGGRLTPPPPKPVPDAPCTAGGDDGEEPQAGQASTV
mmetsp:Transcript_10546/g.30970  ORF Transcript_10546/g.30970 Transcript_10546/m.30970 type:complete len:390 (-) Transcript_10546:52-1221(-)